MSTEIINKEYETEKGAIKFVLDLTNIQSRFETYTAALRRARQIPTDLTVINPMDRVLPKIMEVHEDEDLIAAEYVNFYQSQEEQAQRDAIVLALTVDSAFDFDPEPYAEEVLEALPGLVTIQPFPKNLVDPVERRLKQAIDAIEAGGATLLVDFTQMMSRAAIAIQRAIKEVSEEGFRTS